MNKDNAKYYLPLVAALADGKTIQFNLGGGGMSDNWKDAVEISAFNKNPDYYRIKPEPIERWIGIYQENQIGQTMHFQTKEKCERHCRGDAYFIRAIKLIEAQDEN